MIAYGWVAAGGALGFSSSAMASPRSRKEASSRAGLCLP